MLAAMAAQCLFAQDQTFVREPALHPSGEKIAFSYQGDIWLMDLATKVPQRLTLHEAYESSPVFSPDGSRIAFSGNRFGGNDIFTIPVEGGKPQRLTYHSASDQISHFAHDGKVYFTTDRAWQQVEWDDEIYSVSADGGTPVRVLDAFGEMPSVSPDGRYIAFMRGACRITRENYVGPANNEIWVYDTKEASYTQLTNNQVNDIMPKWVSNEKLVYLSSINGRYALVSKELGNMDVEPATLKAYTDEGIHHFDVQGQAIVFSRGSEVFKMTIGSAAEKVEINIPTDYRFYPVEKKTYSANISDYAISPDGKNVALEIRGEIFVAELDEDESRTANISDHPYYDQEMQWLSDESLLFVSDRANSSYDFYVAQSTDEDKKNLFKTLKRKLEKVADREADMRNPQLSPNGKKLAYELGHNKLVVADVDEQGALSNEKVLVDAWHGANGVSWSPDSRFIAYYHDDLNFNSEIYIQAVDGSLGPVNVSMHPGNDRSPVWSEDGSKLAFVSDRNNNDADIWFVWLTEEDWLKSKEEREEGYYFEDEEESAEDEEKEEEEQEEKDEVAPVQIDIENIYDRLVQVTSMSGSEYSPLISKDGETFYFVSYSPVEKGSDLYSVKYDGSDLKQVTKGGKSPSQLSWDKDMKGMYYLSRGRLYHLDPAKGSSKAYPHRAKMTINKVEERKQVFDEAWKILNHRFYDPDFHGQDWSELKRIYRPWALSASTEQDFRYVFNLMLGRLNASHLGIYGGSEEDVQRERTGMLGIEVIPASNGVEVTRVVPRSPADRVKNNLQVGDVITTINGEPINGNFYELLADASGEAVLMTVKGAGSEREVVIRPSASISAALYEEWVAERKRLTEKYSNGRLGYIHIKGMDKPSFERFERELMASGHGKEGIVIDVRFNGGGWTTDYLLAVLSVRQHAYTVPRGATDNLADNQKNFSEYYPYSERLPLSGWTKPSVAMCNESSYSNAEIFSHAYKTLGIGTLVGQPTFGAVISTGGTGLLDGSFIRLPFRGWYVKATGQNMENGPAVPQVLVENQPDARSKKEDQQLKKAVEVLLEQIDEKE